MDKLKISVRQIALFGILGALTFGLKFAMSWLPNIEPVSLLVMLYAVVFGRKCLYPIYLYVALEILFYGIQLWNINYLYVWAILFLAARIMKNSESPLAWALLAGSFGLLFGVLCAPVYVFSGGVSFAIAWWIEGIPFDLLHCAGNFVMALVLFLPLKKLLTRLYQKT